MQKGAFLHTLIEVCLGQSIRLCPKRSLFTFSTDTTIRGELGSIECNGRAMSNDEALLTNPQNACGARNIFTTHTNGHYY